MLPNFFRTFKYISCSYLSSALWRNTRMRKNSNTSHVLIYQTNHLKINHSSINSNTSHVLIYHWVRKPHYNRCGYSNTSHVLIYLNANETMASNSFIQIHLMFLFIERNIRGTRKHAIIQIHLMFLFI